MSLFKFLLGNRNKEAVKKSTVISKSAMPSQIEAANKIHNKEYDQAIEDLKKLLNQTSSSDNKALSMIHINLMEAYFKNRKNNDNYFRKSTYHAKEALKHGHNTGLAPYRLVVNLTREKNFNQAVEICAIVVSPGYKFSIHGFKQKPEFEKKMDKLKSKFNQAEDKPDDKFLTEAEIEMAISNSQKNK